MPYTGRPLTVLVDSRMAVRGLGIATFAHRLTDELAALPDLRVRRWQASGPWGARAQWATLGCSGLFDLSPRLDPRTRRFDVVHHLSNIGSLLPGDASVVTVHDLLYRRSRRVRHRLSGWLLEQSLSRAGRVVAVSGRTAAALVSSWPSLRGRVEIIPHGMRTLAVLPEPRTHVLAFGGASDPRKRVDLMVAGYRRYHQLVPDPVPLVVLARAGLTVEQRAALAALGARLVDQATSSEVDELFARAAAVLYTSRVEGFGLPILEAAEAATPVVMQRGAEVADEVMGRHCVLVDGAEPADWAVAIGQAVDGGPVSGALDLPDWASVATRYADLYRAVAP